MEKVLYRLKRSIDNNLNEYVKWVIIIGLYAFYRMLAAVYEEQKLEFLILPLLFIGIMVLAANWVINHEIQFLQVFQKNNMKTANHFTSILVIVLCLLSIGFIIVYFLSQNEIWIQMALISLLSCALIAMEYPAIEKTQILIWLRVLAYVLILIWTVIFIFDLANNTKGFNEWHFISFSCFLIYYFLHLRFKKSN